MICPKCKNNVIRYGFKNEQQRYYCKNCEYYFTKNTKIQFSNDERELVFRDILSGMDRKEVAKKYNISLRTIQRWIAEKIENNSDSK
ncbi:helix-turn-helix domain-containing protein [Streptococcus uberis]|uniref:IS1/IS1595 family N-terminal zinc-binding domain-containing protein n=1 Tax=Streptococcus uberis TaxID=1349 RepID=UPI0012B5C833|nr:helix-turn-helix domain-containing protein [Streptococcus uberis]MTB36808.1 hypothetical protein [Streptococcus uberis]MTB57790.1 hypothetical protein [Streptococcus uberis]